MHCPNAYPDRIYTDDGVFKAVTRFAFRPEKFKSAEEFIDWVFYCILQVELHEAREFFRLFGHLVYDPHRGGGNNLEPERDDNFPWKTRIVKRLVKDGAGDRI